jgi:hypothetical protein
MNGEQRTRTIIIFLGLLAFREIASFWTGHPWDFEVWIRSGFTVLQGRDPYTWLEAVPSLSFSPYERMPSIGYPPFISILSAACIWVTDVFLGGNRFWLIFLLKQFFILGDLLVAAFMYRMNLVSESRFWLICPLVWLVSSVWGTFDSLVILSILFSLHMISKRRFTAAGLSLGVGIFMKVIPALMVPAVLVRDEIEPRDRLRFAGASILVGFAGSLAPFAALGWRYNGFLSAMSYQASGALGGMSPFIAFEFIKPPEPVESIISALWLPASIACYVYVYFNQKRIPLTEAVLLSLSVFILMRGFVSEQLALYPLALILVEERHKQRNRNFAIAIMLLSTAFLMINNPLLVRFASPVSEGFFQWDLAFNNTDPSATVRHTLRGVFGALFFIYLGELVIMTSRGLEEGPSIFRHMRDTWKYVTYLVLYGPAIIVIDFSVIGLISDWQRVGSTFAAPGLTYFDLYHLSLVGLTLALNVLLITFSKSAEGRARLFITLLLLDTLIAGLSQPIFDLLNGNPILRAGTDYLVFGITIDRRLYFSACVVSSVVGLVSIKEVGSFVTRHRERPVETEQ